MESRNIESVMLFYYTKLLQGQSGELFMTLEQLQTDIKILNGLLDAIKSFFPNNPTENTIITFLEEADNNPIVQNIILLVLNNVLATAELKRQAQLRDAEHHVAGGIPAAKPCGCH